MDHMINHNYAQYSDYLQPKKEQGLPWLQVINQDNNFGIFVPKRIAEQYKIGPFEVKQGWAEKEIPFQGGQEVGYFSQIFRFVVVETSPLLLSTEEGYLKVDNFNPSQKPISFWLILLLSENGLISNVPLTLKLKGASGASFSQELKINRKETETNFLQALNLDEQSVELSPKARQLFKYTWRLGGFSTGFGRAPFTTVVKRRGLVQTPEEQFRYSYNGNVQRYVTVVPGKIEQMISEFQGEISEAIEQAVPYLEAFRGKWSN